MNMYEDKLSFMYEKKYETKSSLSLKVKEF